jgi:signal transduction histidine kinase
VGAITQFSFFNTTAHVGAGEPTYQYSRDFGVPFAGKGLGLVRTRLYARYHGGSLALFSQPGYGTTALLALEKSGAVSSDFTEHPL